MLKSFIFLFGLIAFLGAGAVCVTAMHAYIPAVLISAAGFVGMVAGTFDYYEEREPWYEEE